ncbi:MAG: site-specific integrase [Muribaculaceae bacterium]|nr:site-specific integrase [Muribaculaceae bacterium]
MTSIKVKFRPSAVAGGEGAIYYQIICRRKTRLLPTKYRIRDSEWDGMSVTGQQARIREQVRCDLIRLSRIVKTLENSGVDYSADDVADEFRRYVQDYSLFSFMQRQIDRLMLCGRIRTSETYRATLCSFRRFREGADVMLDAVTPQLMEDYQAWLLGRGIALNTISFYARVLRAVYNQAVDAGAIESCHPFRHVYTGIDKTQKRALPLRVIRSIRKLDLSDRPPLDYARDMFLLSFYFRGMSFIDMAFLHKTDLSNGILSYRRRKTRQRLSIGWTREMQEILDKYPENASSYLLPIIRRTGLNERCVYRNVGYNINRNLKKIARMVGVDIPLTLYVARHSWASAANSKGIPLNIISEGMGHDSQTTTMIYLASLDTAVIDRANSLILDSLK